LMLGDCIEKSGINDVELPRKFFAAQARFQAEPWGLATASDFRVPGTEGKRSMISRVTAPLIGKMFEVANDDPAIGERIGEVINMVKPPSVLFEASMLKMIAKAWSRRLIKGRPRPEALATMPPLALGVETLT
jgi:hypothetical protein